MFVNCSEILKKNESTKQIQHKVQIVSSLAKYTICETVCSASPQYVQFSEEVKREIR